MFDRMSPINVSPFYNRVINLRRCLVAVRRCRQ
uniref:Uncharacterized protein n=1 Tax=Anguilla anguilla TaxID=7936 RepID=A0A0E9V4G1_ANGAN